MSVTTDHEKHHHHSVHHLWWLLIVGVIGICAYLAKSNDVFPSASINLAISKTTIGNMAADWSRREGFTTDGTISSTVFSYDDSAKTFLEYELGLGPANALMKKQIPVWYWTTRFCRPLQIEENSVDLSPDGRLLSFNHSIENSRPLPSLSHADALTLAENFVQKDAGIALDKWTLIDDGSSSQPHRIDHYFTWEDKTTDYHGAHIRTHVYISGNIVSSFGNFLHIPESWARKFSKLRSYNQSLEEIAGIFYTILEVATFFVFLWAFIGGLLRWRLAFFIGAASAVMSLLESLNSLPQSIASYTTTMSYQGYLMDVYVSAASTAINQFIQIFLLAGSAEALYRLANPHKIALEKIFSDAGMRCRQTIIGLIAGYGTFGVHLLWVVFFYLFGRKIGLWAPLEIRDIDGLSSYFPAFSSLYIGFSAAVFEELSYRVLGMNIARKLVGNFWLANLLQAAAWAFMHSNYAQEPPYARGVELTVVGLFYGFILRQFGLLPCIVSHYVFDTFIGVAPLISSPVVALKLQALLAVSPFLIALVLAWYLVKKKGRVTHEEELSNESIKPTVSLSEAEAVIASEPYKYVGLSKNKRLILAAIISVATLIEFAFYFPTLGGNTKLVITRQEAIDKAKERLLERGIDANRYYVAAWLSKDFNPQSFQYIFEKAGFAKANQLINKPEHPLVWRVRFFRILDPTEYMVVINNLGQIVGVSQVLAEDAPGAHLSQDTAKALVENYIARNQSQWLPLNFEDADQEHKPNRTDWTFRYLAPNFKVADADYHVSNEVQGDFVADVGGDWQLPDQWVFEREKRTLRDQIASYALFALNLILAGLTLWWMRGVARVGAIRWRPAIFIAVPMTLLVIPQALNDWPELFVTYGTDTPLSSYVIAQGVHQILTAVSMMAIVTVLSAFALAVFRIIFPTIHLASLVRVAIPPTGAEATDAAVKATRNFWQDAVLVGFAAGIGQKAINVLLSYGHSVISPNVTTASLDAFCKLSNAYSPSLDALMDSLSWGIYCLLAAGILVGLYAKYCRSFYFYLGLITILSVLHPLSEKYWQDYLIDAVGLFINLLCVYLFITKFARQNLLAYFLAGVVSMIVGVLRILLILGPSVYLQEITTLALVLLVPIIYLVILYTRRQPFPDEADEFD
jgi:hypothetical protein